MIIQSNAVLPYRQGVGIVLINSGGLIWVGRRCERFDGEAWQMPQGGIDPSEDPELAALRELMEETGTNKAEIITASRHWYEYDIPRGSNALKGKYRGQRQKWFAMRFLGSDDDFNILSPPGGAEPEFDAWRWAEANEVVRMIVDFKRPLYEAVVGEFRGLLR
jgi:putative (di)nucleoside polyphosphate hydrolase